MAHQVSASIGIGWCMDVEIHTLILEGIYLICCNRFCRGTEHACIFGVLCQRDGDIPINTGIPFMDMSSRGGRCIRDDDESGCAGDIINS